MWESKAAPESAPDVNLALVAMPRVDSDAVLLPHELEPNAALADDAPHRRPGQQEHELEQGAVGLAQETRRGDQTHGPHGRSDGPQSA